MKYLDKDINTFLLTVRKMTRKSAVSSVLYDVKPTCGFFAEWIAKRCRMIWVIFMESKWNLCHDFKPTQMQKVRKGWCDFVKWFLSLGPFFFSMEKNYPQSSYDRAFVIMLTAADRHDARVRRRNIQLAIPYNIFSFKLSSFFKLQFLTPHLCPPPQKKSPPSHNTH